MSSLYATTNVVSLLYTLLYRASIHNRYIDRRSFHYHHLPSLSLSFTSTHLSHSGTHLHLPPRPPPDRPGRHAASERASLIATRPPSAKWALWRHQHGQHLPHLSHRRVVPAAAAVAAWGQCAANCYRAPRPSVEIPSPAPSPSPAPPPAAACGAQTFGHCFRGQLAAGRCTPQRSARSCAAGRARRRESIAVPVSPALQSQSPSQLASQSPLTSSLAQPTSFVEVAVAES